MADFVFVLKALLFTAVVFVLMQIRVGEATIEKHTQAWIQTSPAIEVLRGVSDGAVKAAAQGYRWAAGFIDGNVNQAFRSESRPGSRSLGLSMERSDAVKKAEEEKAKRAEQEVDQPDLD